MDFEGKCPHCGWEVSYTCEECKTEIYPLEAEQCKNCGWFHCPECHACLCTRSFIPGQDKSNKEITIKSTDILDQEERK